MAGLKDLVESVVSLGTTLGGKAVVTAGKSGATAIGRKIGWAKGGDSGGGSMIAGHSLSGHKLSGHRMGGLGGSGRKNMHNFDPAADYQAGLTSGHAASLKGGYGSSGGVRHKPMGYVRLNGLGSTSTGGSRFKQPKVGSSRKQGSTSLKSKIW